jgi:hypothetical protein
MNTNLIPHSDQLRLEDNVVLPSRKSALRAPRHKPGQNFVKGPIPLDWLSVAAKQSGKALHVAVGLWFRAGIRKSNQMRFPMSWLDRVFGVNRTSAYRGLAALEKAGLVSVVRHRGRASIVTLLGVSDGNTI